MNETYVFTEYQKDFITGNQEIGTSMARVSNDGGTTVMELSEMFLEFLRGCGYVNKVEIDIYVKDTVSHSIVLDADMNIHSN